MKSRLAGRIALVTGGAERLGRAAVAALAEAGADTVIHYHTARAPAELLAEEIRGKNRRAWTVAGDLSLSAECERLWRESLAACGGPIEILVNNASIFPSGRLDTTPIEDFAENMRINAFAPLALARNFAAQFRGGAPREGWRPGVVNLLDSRPVASFDPEHAAYALSKQTLHALTRTLAVEFAPHIRVNAVAPGLVLEPRGKDRDYLEKLAHSCPLQRVGNVDDVTAATMFLLESEFVTGQVVFVDGGRHLRS